MIDSTKIALAMSKGFPITCSTCTKFWGAQTSANLDKPCLSINNCGGPLSGQEFPDYDGPITDFAQYCYVCGTKSTHAVRVNNSVRVFGCCPDHIKLFDKLQANNAKPVNVTIKK